MRWSSPTRPSEAPPTNFAPHHPTHIVEVCPSVFGTLRVQSRCAQRHSAGRARSPLPCAAVPQKSAWQHSASQELQIASLANLHP
eukprot:89027-Alexandrium_andersonii.AAC.1